MCYNEVSVENEIILSIYAEKGPYNMTMWFDVPLTVTDTLSQFIFGVSFIEWDQHITTHLDHETHVIISHLRIGL